MPGHFFHPSGTDISTLPSVTTEELMAFHSPKHSSLRKVRTKASSCISESLPEYFFFLCGYEFLSRREQVTVPSSQTLTVSHFLLKVLSSGSCSIVTEISSYDWME